jgi:hypothetical protein
LAAVNGHASGKESLLAGLGDDRGIDQAFAKGQPHKRADGAAMLGVTPYALIRRPVMKKPFKGPISGVQSASS